MPQNSISAQLSNLHQIAQFQQVVRHAEMSVILVDFLLQHGDTA